MNADTTDDWVCQCRRCHGVHTTADAVQYAYELWMDLPQRALVAAFAFFGEDGRTSLSVPFLDGEPDVVGITGGRVWAFSFRPRRGAVPTEGDIARWERWHSDVTNLVDWIVVDGDRWASIAGTVAALLDRRPVPRPETFSNYWWRE